MSAQASEAEEGSFAPSSMSRSMSSKEVTTSFDKSSTYGPSEGCSRTLRLLWPIRKMMEQSEKEHH